MAMNVVEGTNSRSRPLLSVVMPTHNVRRWVDAAISSVLSQEGIDLELIVVDDHSSDGTWEIVAECADRDERLRVFRSPGNGSSAARNAGVEASRGVYLAFVDSDDAVAPDAYAVLTSSLEASGSDVALGNHADFTDDVSDAVLVHPLLERATFASIDENPGLIHRVTLWGAVYRREVWIQRGIVARPAIRSNDLVPKTMALLTAGGIDTVEENVYYYRVRRGANVMTQRAATAAGLASHFGEHLERARVIASLGSRRVLDEAAGAFVYMDGVRCLCDFAVGGSASAEEARALRGLTRASIRAYGVSLTRYATSWRGVRNLDKLIVWISGAYVAWPVGLLPARLRRRAKRVFAAIATRSVAVG